MLSFTFCMDIYLGGPTEVDATKEISSVLLEWIVSLVLFNAIHITKIRCQISVWTFMIVDLIINLQKDEQNCQSLFHILPRHFQVLSLSCLISGVGLQKMRHYRNETVSLGDTAISLHKLQLQPWGGVILY